MENPFIFPHRLFRPRKISTERMRNRSSPHCIFLGGWREKRDGRARERVSLHLPVAHLSAHKLPPLFHHFQRRENFVFLQDRNKKLLRFLLSYFSRRFILAAREKERDPRFIRRVGGGRVFSISCSPLNFLFLV